jgi:arylsulfatase A-like enzyme/Flp pilus assembly protein TadD
VGTDRAGLSRAFVAWATAVGLLALVSCGRAGGAAAPALRSGQLERANVLLVTIDTLRRDRLGTYGGAAGLTPVLDRLAAQGIRYSRAFSHVPMTLPAHTSIMTGLTPRRHGVHNNTTFRLDARVPTLATTLKGAGYRTGAFVGAFVLDARFGLNQGFDEYDDRLPHREGAAFHFAERRAADVVKAAGDWILELAPGAERPAPGAPRSPWFAWVHLFDPHAPYDAPAEYRAGRTPYDAEVAYVDATIGRFLDRLRAARALDRTLVVVTADHGESLGDHGESTHGLFAYDSTIAVPLVVAGDGIPPGRVDAPVGHADIAPTILDLVGIPAPDGVEGQSLVRPPAPDRAIYFEALDAALSRGWAPLVGLVQDGWKYIDLPEPELYDLFDDPGETRNRFGQDPRGERLRRAVAGPDLTRGGAASAPLDAEAAARLRSLGYVGSAMPVPRRAPTAADDPKRLVALSERFNSALTAFDEGRVDEALSSLVAILRARPDFLVARTSAATILLAGGRAPDAVGLLRQAPADQAASGELLAKVGSALRETGDLRGAASALQRARQSGNGSAEVESDLGVVYAQLGRTDEARAVFRELLARDAGAATVWYNLGVVELQARRPADGADALRRAVAIEPQYGDAWKALGSALADAGRPAEAIDAWRHAERLMPRDYDVLFNLAMLLSDSDRPAEAIPFLERFAREAPRARYAQDLARIHATLARLAPGRS